LTQHTLLTSQSFHELILQRTPFIDVRAPTEFAKGALPNAINLPFINDEERHQIGICYKEKGQQAAIDLGYQLVSDSSKSDRIQTWKTFLIQHPNALIYCARGGLRSQLSQQWLAEAGVHCPRVEGGFKALRMFLLQSVQEVCRTSNFTLLSGMTGTGKTDIIKILSNSIDLEGHANHKGSSFGRPLDMQPAQINFENSLICDLLRAHENMPKQGIILEDENRSIGALHLPDALNAVMSNSSMIVIELAFEERIEKLWQEYVLQRYQDTIRYHQARHLKNPHAHAQRAFSGYLTDSLMRIKKRLGSQRCTEILSLMKEAIKLQHSDNFYSHKHWLRAITHDYYDPMYRYQLEKRKDRVVFTGNHQSVIDFIKSKTTET
jgi:tRNA 2-selenouridine synthase